MRSQVTAAKKHYWQIAPTLLAGLLLRLWLLLEHANVSGDAFTYGNIAKSWLMYGVYGIGDVDVRPTLMRLPGYPAFIAACFRIFGMENYFSVLAMQVFFDLLSCILIAAAARRLFGNRAGIAALWLSSLCLFTANYATDALAESLSIFCISWAIYAVVCWRDALPKQGKATLHLVSLSFALIAAIYLRPDNGLLAAALLPAVFLIAWRQAGIGDAMRAIGICSAIILLSLVPWTIRNYQVFGVFQPLAPRLANDPGEFVTTGFNRWYRSWDIDYASNEEVYWNPGDASIEFNSLPTRVFDSPQQQADTAGLIAEYNQDQTISPELDAKFNALAEDRIRNHAVRYYMLLPTARLMNMWLRPRVELFDIDLRWWEYSQHPEETWIAVGFGALNLAYIILAAMGWGRLRRHDAILWALAAYVMLRCILLLTLDNSEPRYTLECFPVLFLLGAAVFGDGDTEKTESY
jgi:4-amino-4-deoxy-L-arabinose transferase-like glycosyltransferase